MFEAAEPAAEIAKAKTEAPPIKKAEILTSKRILDAGVGDEKNAIPVENPVRFAAAKKGHEEGHEEGGEEGGEGEGEEGEGGEGTFTAATFAMVTEAKDAFDDAFDEFKTAVEDMMTEA